MHAVIAITNETTVLDNALVQHWIPAMQEQLSKHLIPLWPQSLGGVVESVSLSFVAKGAKPPKGAWLARIMDNSDQPGALGYHTDEGLPETYVFAKTTIGAGLNPSVTLSHELCEMVVDPTTQLVDRRSGSLNVYAREVCDPVEADQLGYSIGDVMVSDFVTPAWFGHTNTARDYMGHLRTAFSLAPGGYVLVYSPGRGWHQIFARGADGSVTLGRPGTGGRTQHRLGDSISVAAIAAEE